MALIEVNADFKTACGLLSRIAVALESLVELQINPERFRRERAKLPPLVLAGADKLTVVSDEHLWELEQEENRLRETGQEEKMR